MSTIEAVRTSLGDADNRSPLASTLVVQPNGTLTLGFIPGAVMATSLLPDAPEGLALACLRTLVTRRRARMA